MKCNQAQSLMLDHLYGGLKPRKEEALLLHLRECPACANEYETHKATASAFAKLDMEEPPPGLTAKLVAMAAEDVERRKSVRTAARGRNWMPALATAAAAVFAVVFVIRFIPQVSKQTRMAPAPVMLSKEEAKKAPMPKASAKRGRALSRSEISAVSPMAEAEPRDEYRLNAKATTEDGFYARERDGLDSNGLGDDIATDNLAVGEPYSGAASAGNRVSGLVGGKASVDGPREPQRRLQTPELQIKQKSAALGYGESGSFGRSDFKDSSGRLQSDKEAAAELPDSSPDTSSVTARYSHANNIENARLGEEVAVTAQKVEAPVSAKPRAAASEPEETKALLKSRPKKVMSPAVGGSVADIGAGGLIVANGEHKFDLDSAREEQLSVDAVFDARELNEAVAEYEKSARREPQRQFTAEIRYKLGKTYQEEDDCEKALAVYETIPDEQPDFDGLADVYIAMGECYLKLNRFDDALRSFALVREKFPDKSELAAKKSAEIVAAQKALEKTNEAKSAE